MQSDIRTKLLLSEYDDMIAQFCVTPTKTRLILHTKNAYMEFRTLVQYRITTAFQTSIRNSISSIRNKIRQEFHKLSYRK